MLSEVGESVGNRGKDKEASESVCGEQVKTGEIRETQKGQPGEQVEDAVMEEEEEEEAETTGLVKSKLTVKCRRKVSK